MRPDFSDYRTLQHSDHAVVKVKMTNIFTQKVRSQLGDVDPISIATSVADDLWEYAIRWGSEGLSRLHDEWSQLTDPTVTVGDITYEGAGYGPYWRPNSGESLAKARSKWRADRYNAYLLAAEVALDLLWEELQTLEREFAAKHQECSLSRRKCLWHFRGDGKYCCWEECKPS